MNTELRQEDILKKLQQVEISVAQSIKASDRELLQTRYYQRFTVNSKQGQIDLENVYITVEQEKDGQISYHFRWLDKDSTLIEEKILVQDGKVYTIPELDDLFGDTEMDMEELVGENDRQKGNLRGISEKSTPEQTKKLLAKKDGKDNSDEEKEDEETQQIEADLAEQGEEVRIGKHREIKDDKIAEIMPAVFENGKKYVVAEDKVTGKAMILEKENGQYKKNQKVEQGQTTTKRIFTIEPNGEQKESEIPDQIMTIPGEPDQELSMTSDQYGDLHVQAIQITPCYNRIARPFQMDREGAEAQEDNEITRMFEQEGGAELAAKISDTKRELEETYGVTESDIEQLKQLDIEAVMEAEARKARISKEGFKEYVKKATGKTLQDKINSAHEDIEQEYKGGKRPR